MFVHTILSHNILHTPFFTKYLCPHNFVTQHLAHILFYIPAHTIFVRTTLSHAIFAWQAWYLNISTFVLRGRGGTWSHQASFCVVGMVLMALGGALESVLVAGDVAAVCMAGMVLGHIYLHFAWQAWHLRDWVAHVGRF